MRLALFGGSFDPIHRGHLAVARAAADAFALDRILFAPVGRQPLKHDGHTAPYDERLAMTTLACAGSDPRFAPSSIDAPRSDGTPNYTAETLELLQAQHPDDELFNLAGADTFQHLASWHRATNLIDLAEWIVVSRPGVPLRPPQGLPITPTQRTRIHMLDSIHEEVSATELRQRLAAGDPCTDLLPAPAASYIAQHHLYSLPNA